jgi:nucleoid DNA-binding protein
MPASKPKLIKNRYTKTQIITELSESTDLTKKEVSLVIDELSNIIERHIKKRSCGEFVLPGLLKITTLKKKATKDRKGINPFTGEEAIFKAKPASVQVKVRPLKRLKDMAI